MEKLIDLHTHSTASDGSMSPAELVRHAKESGLAAVAVTDHDTVFGIAEAFEEGARVGIEVIAGIEIGVEFKPEMHILGYFFGDNYLKIKSILDELRKNRDIRNPKIVAKLNELGFDITLEEVAEEAKGNVVGRPHIAKVLMNKGYVGSVDEAFEKYLASGRPAYYIKDKLTPGKGIQEILKAGGIPVLAHPIHLGFGLSQLDDLLGKLNSYGLKGVEVYYVDNSESDIFAHRQLAEKYNLVATGGSDFHGIFKPDIAIGRGRGNLKVTYDVLENLKKVMAK